MMSSQTIIDAASNLGKIIRESDEYEAFVTSRSVAELDVQAYHLLTQYRKQEQKMHELMSVAAPDISDLHRCMKDLDEMKDLMMDNDIAREYIHSSAAMMAMVAQINETLGHFVDISPLMPKSEKQCGCGDCGKH